MRLGIDRIDEYIHIFSGKRVGLITNQTGISSKYGSTIDLLDKKVNLVALFAPEHGIRGEKQAGVKLESDIDEKTKIPIFSLYSQDRKPTQEMLALIDILCIDIQDIGSRFYTYIYTMAYSMIACNEYKKEFVVLDRPNPINGIDVEGNLLNLDYRSFIGYYPLVQRHGMTIGELANLFNNHYKINCNLQIIKMKGWNRNDFYPQDSLLWVAPSPNCPTPRTALVYAGTCIFEGTNISEGRGTTQPFEIIGAPYINPDYLSDIMNKFHFPGVYFRPVYFHPTFFKYADKLCGGVQIHVLNPYIFTPVKVGWAMFEAIRNLYPHDFKINPSWRPGGRTMVELNTGCDYLQKGIYSWEELCEILDNDTKEFKKVRERYLLY